MRDKLIELIVDAENGLFRQRNYFSDSERIEKTVDYLISHGVTFAGDNNVLTNGDRIRAMSDEELAKEFESMASYCAPGACPNVEICRIERCVECWLNWLKQPAKEET